MAAENVDLIFDPIFGPRQKTKFEKDSEKLGKKSGDKFSKGFSKETKGSLSKSFAGVSKGLLKRAAALGGAYAAVSFVKGAIQTAASFEKINTQLETLTGSAQTAKVVFKELKEFSASTPFQLQDIANAATKLIAFGETAGSVTKVIKSIGEVAAGSGANIGELSLIFGQVSAAGKLTGERLLQMQERAIPIGPAIEKIFGKTTKSVRQLVSEGRVSTEIFKKAFDSMSESGGIFENSLKKQSGTINGIFSTFKDNFSLFSGEVGKSFGPSTIAILSTFTVGFQKLSKAFEQNGPAISRTLSKMSEFLIVKPSQFMINFLSGRVNANTVAKQLEAVNSEMSLLNKETQRINDRLLEVANSGKFFKFIQKATGMQKAHMTALGESAKRMKELKKEQAELNKIVAEASPEFKKQIMLAEEKRQADLKRTKATQDAAKAILATGQIGLTQEQKLRTEKDKNIALLELAAQKDVTWAGDAAARKLVVEAEFQTALAGLKKTATVKSIGDLGLTETQALTEKFERDKKAVNDSLLLQREKNQRLIQLQKEFKAELASITTASGGDFETLGDRFSSAFDIMTDKSGDFQKKFKVTSEDIATMAVNGIGKSMSGGFEAFGKALVTGENAMGAFTKAFISSIGQQAAASGARFILEGTAMLFVPGMQAAGGAMIAAGGALSAFGGILSAATSGGSTASASTSGTSDSSSSTALSEASVVDSEPEERSTQSTLAINIAGDWLDTDESGLKLIELIEKTYDTTGAVVRTRVA